jgi:Mrp family chromosome partitioning ATPase
LFTALLKTVILIRTTCVTPQTSTIVRTASDFSSQLMRIFSDIDNDGSADPAGVREQIRTNLSGVGATIALASARGGVGKSMLAVNIAAA